MIAGYTVQKNKAFGWVKHDDPRFPTWEIQRGYPVAYIYDGGKCECSMFKQPIAILRPKGWDLDKLCFNP